MSDASAGKAVGGDVGNSRRPARFKWVLWVPLSLLVILVSFCAIVSLTGTRRDVEKIAKPILVALDMYKSANGAYPETLDALVPKYIDKIPDIDDPNLVWYYYTDISEQYFHLGEAQAPGAPHVPLAGYNSATRTWYRADDMGT